MPIVKTKWTSFEKKIKSSTVISYLTNDYMFDVPLLESSHIFLENHADILVLSIFMGWSVSTENFILEIVVLAHGFKVRLKKLFLKTLIFNLVRLNFLLFCWKKATLEINKNVSWLDFNNGTFVKKWKRNKLIKKGLFSMGRQTHWPRKGKNAILFSLKNILLYGFQFTFLAEEKFQKRLWLDFDYGKWLDFRFWFLYKEAKTKMCLSKSPMILISFQYCKNNGKF